MTPLYQRILGERYTLLPLEVQRLYDTGNGKTYRGKVTSERGGHPLCRLVAKILRLPPSGSHQPLQVQLTAENSREHWIRHFGAYRFTSLQWEHRGQLYERLRFVTLVFDIEGDTRGLSLTLRKILLLGIPILWGPVLPHVTAVENEVAGKFHLAIDTSLWRCGLLVRYEGWLEEVNA